MVACWFWVGILCMGPMHWIHGWGLTYGIYPWGSALVMGKFDGATFLGGEEKASGHGQQGRSLDDARFQTAPFCFILYIAQWKFRCIMSSGHREGGPRSSIALGRHVRSSGFNNPSTWFTH